MFAMQNFRRLYNHKMMALSPLVMSATIRNLSVQPITKRIKLITESERKMEKELVSMRSNESSNRPLALIITWLMATPKQQSKFTQIYLDQGFDVLLMDTNPGDLLWPTSGSQKVTLELLEYLAKNDGNYEKMIVHGFSAGGYAWGECLLHSIKNPSRYQPVMDRIVAQVWDSASDVLVIPAGASKSLFPKNHLMQKTLENLILLYMKAFYSTSTCHYVKSSELFYTKAVKAPALLIYSKTDPIGTVATSEKISQCWNKAGIDVTSKCFESSPHVAHFIKHREKYLKYLFAHLRSANLLNREQDIKAKL